MIHFLLLFSRQGKVRLQKWYSSYSEKQKKKYMREIISLIFARKPKMCSFVEWQDMKIVYRRYASLYFACAIDAGDNELITVEIIHRYVEILDKYFGNVCELDIIFHFEKAYLCLDRLVGWRGAGNRDTGNSFCYRCTGYYSRRRSTAKIFRGSEFELTRGISFDLICTVQ
ncbi:hypothetical protein AHF37_08493 [Paragonimus kellicotti]|nr:hypothetical protein AHF37_08493 [Paragonimus kellicotti]